MLTIPEKLLLLALDDEKGRVVAAGGTALPFGLAGAVLVELERRGRIEVDKRQVLVVDARPTGDPILDNALLNLSGSRKVRKPGDWLFQHNKLAPSLRERLLERLVQAGILRRETHEFLWVFHFQRYPTEEDRPERVVRETLRAILFDGRTPAPEDAALLCLVHACNLAREVFPDYPAREARSALKAFAEGDAVAAAVSASVAAVTMMVTAAVAASITASTAASH